MLNTSSRVIAITFALIALAAISVSANWGGGYGIGLFAAKDSAGSQAFAPIEPMGAPAMMTALTLLPPDAPFTFNTTGALVTARYRYTATLLPNGKVLVVGGTNGALVGATNPLSSAELYDPEAGTWSVTGSLAAARYFHTATLLPNGKVLVAGGRDSSNNTFGSAELYDPAAGTWSSTDSLATARYAHTATLLPNGKVLVAGGAIDGSATPTASVELYDPATGTWSATGPLVAARGFHTATILPNNKVLAAGGRGEGLSNLVSAELYDPAAGTWSGTGSLGTARLLHTATLLTNGKVLVAGGRGNAPLLSSAELYDPAGGTWSYTVGSLAMGRYQHTATLLPNGKVLVTGGQDISSNALSSAELYDPAAGTWSGTGALATPRYFQIATLLPNGKVLVEGGLVSLNNPLSSAELYDPAAGTWSDTTSPLTAARFDHTATLLPNGKVLVAGGRDSSGNALSNSELYDPAAGTWSNTGSLATARYEHTATLLPNGIVLVAGGKDNAGNALGSAELYDPVAGTWSAAGSLAIVRYGHTATLLPTGKVLVVGGSSGGGTLSSAELYYPAAGTWMGTGSLAADRFLHTATLLTNGKVLVAGGDNGITFLSSAELYDLATGTWSSTDGLAVARYQHTATLLSNGKVLVAGGSGSSPISSAELYDPVAGTWSGTGALAAARYRHTATLLPNGTVLVAAGINGSALGSSEVYDPAAATWSYTSGSLAAARYQHTATLLPNGRVLVAGGQDPGAVSSTELYDAGLGFSSAWQPQIASATSPLTLGSQLILTGTRFKGISQASSGSTQDSSTNYPVVQLRSLDNGQVAILTGDPAAGWTNISFTSTPVNGFVPGPALVTVFANGIPGNSKYVVVAGPTVSGSITYGNAIGSPASPRFVKNVSLSSTAGAPLVGPVITGTPGTYVLTGLGAGSYTIKPSKPGGPNTSIGSADAARVAQGVSSSVPWVTLNQKFVADASGNGNVTSTDAALIARFAAGLTGTGNVGQWKFFTADLPGPPTAPLPTPPYNDSRTYASVVGNLTGENYVALLIGEATGNYNPASHPRPANGPERSTDVELPQMTASTDKEIIIPVSVQGAADKGIISYEFDFRYDPSVIQPVGDVVDVKGTASRGLSVVTNATEPGLVRVVVYGAFPIDKDGVLLNLIFTAVGKPGAISPLSFEQLMFNEGEPRVSAVNGRIEIF